MQLEDREILFYVVDEWEAPRTGRAIIAEIPPPPNPPRCAHGDLVLGPHWLVTISVVVAKDPGA